MVSDLVARLRAFAGLSALVGTRIRPHVLGQGETYPAVTYYVTSQVDADHLRGPGGLPATEMTFDCYASTYGQAEAVADQIRLALDGYRGLMGSTRVQMALVVDARGEGYDWPDDASQSGYYRAGVDVRIVWEQTPAALLT